MKDADDVDDNDEQKANKGQLFQNRLSALFFKIVATNAIYLIFVISKQQCHCLSPHRMQKGTLPSAHTHNKTGKKSQFTVNVHKKNCNAALYFTICFFFRNVMIFAYSSSDSSSSASSEMLK